MAALRLTAPCLPFRRLSLWLLLATAAVLGVAGCDGGGGAVPQGFERVTINGKTFTLELALDEATRQKGLGGRAEIPPTGGMLFVFTDADVRKFVMRDCLVPIDIIFLDPTGRVTATHHMPVDARKPGEDDRTYELRLEHYSSRYASQFVIELAGGTLETLGVEEGQEIELDRERLKGLAR